MSTNPAVVATSGSGSATGIVPVGEMELGAEWSHAVWGRIHVFGQLGVFGQFWGGAGNSSEGTGLAPGNLGTQSSSQANFGFIGGVGRLGFSF